MNARELLALCGAFLVGSIPFSLLIARRRGVDLRTVGSGNVGATNLARSLGFGPGAAGFLLDAVKGAVAVLLPRLLAGPVVSPVVEGLAAILAVVGHIASPFLGFKGGKGVATGAGAFAVIAPWATLAAVVVFAAAVGLTRVVGLGSVLASVTLPAASALLRDDRAITVSAVVVGVVVIVRHRSNLARLMRGTENRLGKGDRA